MPASAGAGGSASPIGVVPADSGTFVVARWTRSSSARCRGKGAARAVARTIVSPWIEHRARCGRTTTRWSSRRPRRSARALARGNRAPCSSPPQRRHALRASLARHLYRIPRLRGSTPPGLIRRERVIAHHLGGGRHSDRGARLAGHGTGDGADGLVLLGRPMARSARAPDGAGCAPAARWPTAGPLRSPTVCSPWAATATSTVSPRSRTLLCFGGRRSRAGNAQGRPWSVR